MYSIEHRPKQNSVELERTHRLALQFRRVAMVQRNRERFIGVTSSLGHHAKEVIKAARIDPGIIFFESREARCHQIGCEKFRERRCNCNRPRLITSEIHISIYGETNSRLQKSILQQFVSR